MPVPIKQAVANAAEFAKGILGDSAQDIQLEEVEGSDARDVWLITLSMTRPSDLPRLFGKRDYKTFTVRKEDGQVTDMKIRVIAGQ